MTRNLDSELPALRKLAKSYTVTFVYVLGKNRLRFVSINAFKDRFWLLLDRLVRGLAWFEHSENKYCLVNFPKYATYLE